MRRNDKVFAEFITGVVRAEGGYDAIHCDKDDLGGLTRAGLTWKTVKAYYGIPYIQTAMEDHVHIDLLRTLKPTMVEDKIPVELAWEFMKSLSIEEIDEIYYREFYQKHRMDFLPENLRRIVFSAGIMSGPRRSIKWLQQALNTCEGLLPNTQPLVCDGILGPKTLEKLNNIHNLVKLDNIHSVANIDQTCSNVIQNFTETRIKFYVRITKRRPANLKFLEGWINRAFMEGRQHES